MDWEKVVQNKELLSKVEELYVWNIGQSVDKDEDVISFYRFGKYRKECEKSSQYEDIDVKQLYKELFGAFSKWNNNADSWEDEDYKSFYCSNMETYGYVKEIHIYRYEQKCLRCTFTNMNEVEKDVFVKIVSKYCNHIVVDEK